MPSATGGRSGGAAPWRRACCSGQRAPLSRAASRRMGGVRARRRTPDLAAGLTSFPFALGFTTVFFRPEQLRPCSSQRTDVKEVVSLLEGIPLRAQCLALVWPDATHPHWSCMIDQLNVNENSITVVSDASQVLALPVDSIRSVWKDPHQGRLEDCGRGDPEEFGTEQVGFRSCVASSTAYGAGWRSGFECPGLRPELVESDPAMRSESSSRRGCASEQLLLGRRLLRPFGGPKGRAAMLHRRKAAVAISLRLGRVSWIGAAR